MRRHEVTADQWEAIQHIFLGVGQRRGDRHRTNDGLGRLNNESNRTRVAVNCSNETSLLRPASDVLPEISDDWEAGQACLAMEDK
jgi:hypothetical protein